MATIFEQAFEIIRAQSTGDSIPTGTSVTVNFHPDIYVGDKTVIQCMSHDKLYRSQFETRTSNGGLTAFPGGDRWKWESTFFGGVYDRAAPASRPKYGALNYSFRRTGGSPRFGSCHLRLRPEVLARTTFCYPESHFGPEAFGVADRMSLSALAERNARNLDPFLDNYIEAHVHGPISIPDDVEAVVLDPSYHGSAVEAFAAKLGCHVEWHDGFRLQLSKLLEEDSFRPRPAIEAIRMLEINTPTDLGAVRGKTLDYQTSKWVWHCLARFGEVETK